MRKGIKPISLGAAALLLAGCSISLCPEDRLLLSKSIDASRTAASQCARQTESGGSRSEQSVQSASGQGSGMKLESAVQQAETAAARAQLAAERAELAAEMARKVFESGLRK